MIKFIAIITPLILLSSLISAPLSAADKQEIMDVDLAFSAMAKTTGLKPAFDHYLAKDATALNPKQNAVHGRMQITASMSSDPSRILLQWEPQDGMIAASEDLACTWGTYVLTMMRDGETTASYGKYTTIWIKDQGRWKAILDMGNASPAPGVPKTE